MINASGYSAVTVYLYADMKTVYERGAKRDHQDDRHPGHLLERYHKETYTPEQLNSISRIAPEFDEFVASISHKNYNVALGLDIAIDVTDFGNVDYEDIYRKIVEYETNA